MTRQLGLTGISGLLVLATLAACGGGGDGGGGASPSLPRSWGTAVLIETDNAGSAFNQRVAVDAAGTAIVVWQQSDGTRVNIWANRYAVGQGWGTAQLIENDDTGDAGGPRVAVDAAGNAIAIWSQSDGARFNMLSNRYTVGQGWGTAQLIEANDAGDAQNPQLAGDAAGNAIAVWQQLDGSGRSDISANRYTAGQGWGTAQLIETDDAGHAVEPRVALDAGGNAIAVWRQSDGLRYSTRANRYTAGAGWGAAAPIETGANDASGSHVAFDANGNAIAVWSQFDGTRANIWANRYSAGSGWGTAQLIETNDAGSAFSSHVAFDPNGNAIAAWRQFDGTRTNIWANRYSAGSGWGTAQLIETNDAGDAEDPQVAFDPNGNAIAVWNQSNGTRYDVWANRYSAGSGWGTPQLIEANDAGDTDSPRIAFDANGNAIAVWYQFDGARSDIWANRFQ